jgi:hypothetical protein
MDERGLEALWGTMQAEAAWRMDHGSVGSRDFQDFVTDVRLVLGWLHDAGPAVSLTWSWTIRGVAAESPSSSGGRRAARRTTPPRAEAVLRVAVLGATAADRDARLQRCVVDLEDLLGVAGAGGLGLRRLSPKARVGRGSGAARGSEPTRWYVLPQRGPTLTGAPFTGRAALRKAMTRLSHAGTGLTLSVTLRSDAAASDVRRGISEAEDALAGRPHVCADTSLLGLLSEPPDPLPERLERVRDLAHRLRLEVMVEAPEGLRPAELRRLQYAADQELERSTRLVVASPALSCGHGWALHLVNAVLGRSEGTRTVTTEDTSAGSASDGDEECPF